MNKAKALEALIRELEATKDTLVTSAHEAREAATNEESKSENKYDTRGLEASYLAGAQAKRADELTQVIERLKKIELLDFSKEDSIQLTALVTVEVDGETKRNFFILPYAGGTKIKVGGEEILTITPDSPIGQYLLDKKVNDFFEFNTQAKESEYEVLNIQ